MKIGLASYTFINNDIPFNLSQMEKGMAAAQDSVDLLCFGETFLQGFDSLSWAYERDRDIAVDADSDVMGQLCGMTRRYGVDLLFGYIEKEADALYFSCAVIENGALAYNFRRISKGWKEYWHTDEHYREGTDTHGFLYRGQPVTIALCGDLWDEPERFRTDGLLLWPVYVNFSLDEWPARELEYAQQAALVSRRTLMVNSISETPKSYGGAFYFLDGKIEKKAAYDTDDILIVEI